VGSEIQVVDAHAGQRPLPLRCLTSRIARPHLRLRRLSRAKERSSRTPVSERFRFAA